MQSHAVSPALINNSDNYFRGVDQTQPDHCRLAGWQREFEQVEQNGQLPCLDIVRRSDDPMFNELLWRGLMGGKPYRSIRGGLDLSKGRETAAHPGEAKLVRQALRAACSAARLR